MQVYNEEKYENEKYHRHRLEEQLKEITKQRAMEEEQNRTTLAAHNEMIDELNAKMEAHEARE